LVRVGQEYRATYVRTLVFDIADGSREYFVVGEQCKGTPFLRFNGKAQRFYIADDYV